MSDDSWRNKKGGRQGCNGRNGASTRGQGGLFCKKDCASEHSPKKQCFAKVSANARITSQDLAHFTNGGVSRTPENGYTIDTGSGASSIENEEPSSFLEEEQQHTQHFLGSAPQEIAQLEATAHPGDDAEISPQRRRIDHERHTLPGHEPDAFQPDAFQTEELLVTSHDIASYATKGWLDSLLFVFIAYKSLMANEVFEAFSRFHVLAKQHTQGEYVAHLIYQCVYDFVDNAALLPHVIRTGVVLSMQNYQYIDDDVTIRTVSPHDSRTLKQARKILKGILPIGMSNDELMKELVKYATAPFYMCVAIRGTDAIDGACVFRLNELNTGQRSLHLDLIASKATRPRGIGSTFFRMFRKLCRISPSHGGYISAQCVKTKEAVKFYKRKLPEIASPQARALMVSMFFCDFSLNTLLDGNLDFRCTYVPPLT